MITFELFKKLALSFEGANEHTNFEKPSFRVGKKIFATYDVKYHQACLKLNEIDQSVFSSFDSAIIYPIPNKWGLQGWTTIELKSAPEEMLKDALQTAWQTMMDKKKTSKR